MLRFVRGAWGGGQLQLRVHIVQLRAHIWCCTQVVYMIQGKAESDTEEADVDSAGWSTRRRQRAPGGGAPTHPRKLA